MRYCSEPITTSRSAGTTSRELHSSVNISDHHLIIRKRPGKYWVYVGLQGGKKKVLIKKNTKADLTFYQKTSRLSPWLSGTVQVSTVHEISHHSIFTKISSVWLVNDLHFTFSLLIVLSVTTNKHKKHESVKRSAHEGEKGVRMRLTFSHLLLFDKTVVAVTWYYRKREKRKREEV